MKSKNLLLISILIVVLVFTIFGNGFLKFNYYQSTISNSISSTWNNSKTLGSFNDSIEEISFSDVPVIVVYKTKKAGDTQALNPLTIDISDKDFGSLWFPLIKKSEYDFSVTCKAVHEINTAGINGHFIINGEINVSGDYTFIGSCSKETATRAVADKVLNDIYDEIKRNIK